MLNRGRCLFHVLGVAWMVFGAWWLLGMPGATLVFGIWLATITLVGLIMDRYRGWAKPPTEEDIAFATEALHRWKPRDDNPICTCAGHNECGYCILSQAVERLLPKP